MVKPQAMIQARLVILQYNLNTYSQIICQVSIMALISYSLRSYQIVIAEYYKYNTYSENEKKRFGKMQLISKS